MLISCRSLSPVGNHQVLIFSSHRRQVSHWDQTWALSGGAKLVGYECVLMIPCPCFLFFFFFFLTNPEHVLQCSWQLAACPCHQPSHPAWKCSLAHQDTWVLLHRGEVCGGHYFEDRLRSLIHYLKKSLWKAMRQNAIALPGHGTAPVPQLHFPGTIFNDAI